MKMWGGVERSEAHHLFWPIGWWASLRSTPPYMFLPIYPHRKWTQNGLPQASSPSSWIART